MVAYSRTSPFVTSLISRHRLNKEHSTKETWHVVLSLSGSGITYRPGDSMGICPENDHGLCHAILQLCEFLPDEEVVDPRSGQTFTVLEYLQKKANLSVPTRKLLLELVQRGAKKLD